MLNILQARGKVAGNTYICNIIRTTIINCSHNETIQKANRESHTEDTEAFCRLSAAYRKHTPYYRL